MKAYQCKITGLWKWGTRGKAIYETKEKAQRAGIDIMTSRLREVRDKLDNVILNHGRV